MINEKQFIAHYDSFWNDKLPFGDIFQRKINLEADNMGLGKLVNIVKGRRRSYISHVAFILYKYAVDYKIDLRLVKLTKRQQKEVEEKCYLQFKYYEKQIPNINSELIDIEWTEVYNLAKRVYIFYTDVCKNNNIIFSPKFDGCGVINSCNGDIFTNNCLYEIKMVERNFRVSDIRQLLVYCVLNSMQQNNYEIKEVCLLNPRSGQYFKTTIQNFSIMLSGKEYLSLFDEIYNFITQEIIEE